MIALNDCGYNLIINCNNSDYVSSVSIGYSL